MVLFCKKKKKKGTCIIVVIQHFPICVYHVVCHVVGKLLYFGLVGSTKAIDSIEDRNAKECFLPTESPNHLKID